MNHPDSLPPRQAVHKALVGDWPGRLLRGELVIDDAFVRDFVGLTGEAIPFTARRAVVERLDHDLVVVPFSAGWGSPIQPDQEEATHLLRQWHDESPLFVFALVDGPFTAAAKAWGWDRTLVQLSRPTPDVLRFMAEAVVEAAQWISHLPALGADGVLIGDDIAFRRSTFVNPVSLRQSYFPYLTVLVESCHQAGLPAVFHSDGNLWAILDDLLASGINGLQGLEPGAAMSVLAARQHIGPDFCLWGNVDVGWLARPQPPQDITDHVRRELVQPLHGTPFILSTSGGLMPGLPGANVEAMVQAE